MSLLVLHLLATNCTSEEVREVGVQLLFEFGKKLPQFKVIIDADVFDLLLEILYAVHRRQTDQIQTVEVLEGLIKEAKTNIDFANGIDIRKWEQRVKEVFRPLPLEAKENKSDRLFNTIKSMMGFILTARDVENNLTDLKKDNTINQISSR